MSAGTAPTFTLRLAETDITTPWQNKPVTRWILDSDHVDWPTVACGAGNVNTAENSVWGRKWAAEQIAARSPYTVTQWIEDDAGSTWTAELKRIRHDFRLTWENVPPMVLFAKNQEDADEIERRVLEGESFVRLHNEAGDTVLIGLSQILSITYQPVEVDL